VTRFDCKCSVLTKGTSAEVQFSLRNMQGGLSATPGIPLETFTSNKDMGRVLIRRGGETIGAGMWNSLHASSNLLNTILGVITEING